MVKNLEGLYGVNDFMRGEVYWCQFPPKDLTTPLNLPAPDYNLQGKHMAIMLTDHSNPNVPAGQALVVPISSIKSLNGRDPFATYIPLDKATNPYLEQSSFAKTNQVQPIDRRWIGDKVGQVDPKDMQQVNIGVMLSTGTYKYVEQYIDQHVTRKVMESVGGVMEVAATTNAPAPRDEVMGGIRDFRRADVVRCQFPLTQQMSGAPLSAHTLQGEHLAICLTNHFNNTVPNGQVLVIPLLKESVNARENPNSTIPVSKEDNPYLDGTYHAQTSMIQPMNRHWITDRIGNVHPAQMREINVSILESVGVKQYVEQIIDQVATKKILELSQSKGLTKAPRLPRDMGR